ncbi:MAG: succinate CoA transferase [Clostridiales bacterium]|nr:succinate CoA transferase [Clostridiales bacterium]
MERIYSALTAKIRSAAEAVEIVRPGSVVGCSGFTLVGEPKVVPREIAKIGKAKGITLLTGASVGDDIDGELTRSGCLKMRYPYQSNKTLRSAINEGTVGYSDIHLSHLPEFIDRGGIHIDVAVIECAAVLEEGIVPTASVGASDSMVRMADRVILEVNESLPLDFYGMHDIYNAAGAPIPLTGATGRIGSKVIPCDPAKIAAIVRTDEPGKCPVFSAPDTASETIGSYIVDFLKQEVAAGRQPESLSPIQSGVGSVANAVLAGLGDSGFSGFEMYTEVLQDSALNLILDGKMKGASSTAVSLSEKSLKDFYENIDSLRNKIVLRPQKISNHPEVVRRLGVIAMNTPIECDIYGNVNSTHVMGTRMMNGIGGSGDFARNAGLTIFATASTAKKGSISCIVPMCAHVDHTEHDVQVIVTEQGLADLRWKSPRQRAELIIENCAHPDYRPMLRDYYQAALKNGGHTPHDLRNAFAMHQKYLDTGSML